MADCKKMMELVSAFVDGECSAEETAELKKHLEECASCRTLLAIYENIGDDLFDAQAEPPAELKNSIMSKIKNEPIPFPSGKSDVKAKKSRYVAFVKIAAAAACVALVIYAAPRFFHTGKSTQENSAEMYVTMESAGGSDALEAAPRDAAQDAQARAEEEMQEAPMAAAEPDEDGLYGTTDDNATINDEGITVDSSPPSAAPSPSASTAPSNPGLTYQNLAPEKGQGQTSVYFATVIIEGELPEALAEYEKTDAGDGTFHIVIPAETAKLLIEAGYSAEMADENASEALVIYSGN